jgi:hypothetical protein
MKNTNPLSLIFGLALIVIGGLSLLGNTLLRLEAWRLWPTIVIVAGLILTAPGFLGFTRRGFGAFFIPGVPVLVTGGILMVGSLFQSWHVWTVAWPLEVLGVALGFALAAIFMRVPGLAFPAIIIGLNGLVLAFCNLTGLWSAWALLWPIEPLAVGLSLFVVGFFERSRGAITAGVILSAIAGVGFFFTSFFSMFNLSLLRFAAPAMLVLTGLVVIAASFLRREQPIQPAQTTEVQ